MATNGNDDAAGQAQLEAILDVEQRLVGRILREDPGAVEFAARHLRADAVSFQKPLDRVMATIFAEHDAGRTVKATTIAARTIDSDEEIPVGICEYLRSVAEASPTTISPYDTAKQMRADQRAWRSLQSSLPRPGSIELVRGDAADLQPIDWIWPGWLAAGKLHVLAGQVSAGKTSVAISFAATISVGGCFPDGAVAPLGDTIVWSGEDDFHDSILPRLLANGGNPARLHYVAGRRDEYGNLQPFDPAKDMDELVTAAKTLSNLKLVIIDPVVSAVSGDSNKGAEVRRGLQPMVNLGVRRKAAILGISHLTKGTTERDPIERVTGSLAFAAAPRIVLYAARPSEPGQSRRLVRTKSNIGPDCGGFEYDLHQVALDGDRGISGQGVKWGEQLAGDARALLAELEPKTERDDPSALERAKTWLAELLGTGSPAVPFIQAMARKAGHSWSTVQRAKNALGVEAVKLGLTVGWAWRMPKASRPGEDGPH